MVSAKASTVVYGLVDNGEVGFLLDHNRFLDNLGLVNDLVLDNGLEDGLDGCLSDVFGHQFVHELSVVLHLSLGDVVVLGDELLEVFGNCVMVCGMNSLDNGLILGLVLSLVLSIVLGLCKELCVVCWHNLGFVVGAVLGLVLDGWDKLGLNLSLVHGHLLYLGLYLYLGLCDGLRVALLDRGTVAGGRRHTIAA